MIGKVRYYSVPKKRLSCNVHCKTEDYTIINSRSELQYGKSYLQIKTFEPANSTELIGY